MFVDPFRARYNNDPRYQALVRKLGLIDATTTLPATTSSTATPATAGSAP